MQELLSGLEGVQMYMYDVIVYGASMQEHDTRLKRVMETMELAGLRLNKDKCKIRQSELHFLGQVVDKNRVRADTEKVKAIAELKAPKNIHELKRTGDVYFNTGDLILQDHRDFAYFKDRIGDTFRGKGENVSTTEVCEVLGCLDFLQDVSVYGVTVPGYEGRAGMAAVVLKDGHELDGERLYSHLLQTLPLYAWPWFLRVQTSLHMTGMFKQQKIRLVQEGFSPHAVQQPLYFLNTSQKNYIPLTTPLYEDIISGKIRL
ncbi:long-chain fatty acid transport protein 6-like [Myxocyprinus asiaticus]|uniref:long-chain fatty acid transport protein 6-like n=1 Tax=Myxocyprinus asiaticus TaxID=70543 RepID=UPI0022235C76|nr:long-chain fatty acid transport protein 6-like [Myxocyprinus asiaticus]